MKVLIEQGVDGFKPVMEALLNESMKIEREQHLGASRYERSAYRKGHASGFKPKTLLTRSGRKAQHKLRMSVSIIQSEGTAVGFGHAF